MIENAIEYKVVYNFPIAEVWRAISEKDAVSEWLMPCDISPEVGHKFHFSTKPFPGFDGSIACEVLEVIPLQLLSYSWSGGPLKRTVVTFRLEQDGERTILHFNHSGFEGFLNKLIVQKILANGWKTKILPVLLKNYLEKNG